MGHTQLPIHQCLSFVDPPEQDPLTFVTFVIKP